jgi:hypothetical protein
MSMQVLHSSVVVGVEVGTIQSLHPTMSRHVAIIHWYTSSVEIVCMVADRMHSFDPAGFVDICTIHPTRHSNSLHLETSKLELPIFLHPVLVSGHTVGIPLPVLVAAPPVALPCVEQRTLMAGSATVKESPGNFLWVDLVSSIMRWV